MNNETASSTTATLNGNTASSTVHRVAQKAHEAVDKIEQTVGAGSEKVVSLQQEYGDACREHVRGSPLVSVAAAFGAGILFSKLFLR